MTLIALLTACAEPEEVLLVGTVYASHEPLAPPLPGAELSLSTFDGQPLAAVTADDDGDFEVLVPGGAPLFVSITAHGYATSVFPGSIGLASPQQVEARALYGVSLDEHADEVELFAGCPGLEEPGGVVYGEVRVFGIQDPYTGGSPTTGTGQVTVRDADEASWEACYLDDKGLAYDSEAVFTGGTGRFAVGGVPPGIHDLVVEVLVAPDTWTQNTYPVWITEAPEGDPVVSPWWPLWASFPI